MIVDMRPDAYRPDQFRPDQAAELRFAAAAGPEPEPAYDMAMVDDQPGSGGTRRVVLAVIAITAVAVWLGSMLWLSRAALPGLAPVALVEFVAALAVVPALIGILWLLAMRTSRTEARRFAETAHGMRAESANLERTVAVIARQIDANRRALAEQTTQLMAIGDAATERLGAIGRGLSIEIGQADAHAHGLSEAAAAAQASVGVLLASLPRAQAETVEVGRQLVANGEAANEQAAALDAQLTALAERGRWADAVAGGAAQKLDAHIGRMEETSLTASMRLEAVTDGMSVVVDTLLGRTADAVDDARKGIAAQGEAMLTMVAANQTLLDHAARDSADALAARIAGVEASIERLAERLEGQRRAGDALDGELDHGLAGVGQRLEALHHQGVERSQLLAASISALGGSADAMTEALRAGESMATRTIGTTESLLIALDAAAREIDETLPEALARLDGRIAASKQVVVQAKPELLALVTVHFILPCKMYQHNTFY